MRLLTKVNFLVVHCAATKSHMDVTVSDLRKWHVTENGWSDIGYHYFIKFDGSIHQCRSEKYQGAHCKTVNSNSLAICLEGGFGGIDNFTVVQKKSLFDLIQDRKLSHPNAAVIGHGQIDDKECPSFDVVTWYENNLGG
jgi:N-acetyl-anhydromuramyl-L-alanine amidase AmpD